MIASLPLVAPGGPPRHSGRFCDVYYDEQVEEALRASYGRDHLCLKVLREFDTWEGQSIRAVTIVQNIGAIYGVAPRIYDVVQLADGRMAQITDYTRMPGEPAPRDVRRLVEMIMDLNIGTTKLVRIDGRYKWDIVSGVVNWSAEKFLDWGGYYLEDREGYEALLRERLMVEIASVRRGKGVDATYQSMPALDIIGSRDTQRRIDAMRLAEIDFDGKTVLDLGCNLGAFMFYASDRGAKRVIGVDRRFVADGMREAANWLGYWGLDFVGARLPGDACLIRTRTGIEQFDIVLALAICNHVGGYGSWIADLCTDTLILEGHGGDRPEKYTDALARDFASADLIGYTCDQMTRPVFVCRKEA